MVVEVEVDHPRLLVEVLQVGSVDLEHWEEDKGLVVEQEQGELVRERRELDAWQVHGSLIKFFVFNILIFYYKC